MYTPVIIFRTTSNCNMRCSYCYDKNKLKIDRNPDVLFKNNIDNIVYNINRLSLLGESTNKKVILHGGEPLLIKADTYKLFFKKLFSSDSRCKISIQTNGTLLNSTYIDVFKEYNVRVGISLDGFDESSNACRLYANGKSTFKDVYNNMKLLKNVGINFGVIITINKKLIHREKELYDFISGNNFNCNIRPAFPTKYNNDMIMTSKEYETFFINLYNIWSNDRSKRIGVKQIDDLYQEMRKALDDNYRTCFCSDSKGCFGNFFALDIYGELFACNRTYNNKEFYYGNMNTITDREIIERGNKLKEIRYNSVFHSKCKDCEILHNCYGGCPAVADGIYGSFSNIDDSFCKAKISIHKYIKKDLEESDSITSYNEYLYRNRFAE